eukprot:8670413-Alexandrium_andersonii.AAC.1
MQNVGRPHQPNSVRQGHPAEGSSDSGIGSIWLHTRAANEAQLHEPYAHGVAAKRRRRQDLCAW